MKLSVVLLVVSCSVVNSEFYDSVSGKEINRRRFEEFKQVGLVPYCAIEVAPCDPFEPRRMDGSCNNLHYPPRGATLTPYRRLLPPYFSAGGGLRTSSSGKPLPPARALRVALKSDGRVPSDKYTQMVANYNVFITGDITSVHDTVNYVALTRTCCQPGGRQDPRCIPIEVKDDDPHLRRSNVRCLNLTRAITYQRLGCAPDSMPPERINTAAPMLDLSGVYGNDENGARRGRTFVGGRLRAEEVNGKEWPPSGGRVCVNNVPPRETRCHDSPMMGANSVLGLNVVILWFYRSHNAISQELHELNPCWDDDQLYYTAREINIAYYVHIMYYEMMTELLGWDFLVKNKVVFPTQGHVNDYDPSLEPRVSLEYVVGTRWFHTLQEGRVKLYTKDGRQYDEVSHVDLILRTGALPLNNTIEGVTQGFFRGPGASGAVIDPDIGERILGRLQFASDVVSSDIMKGRDVGVPPYNAYRKYCGLPEAKKFEDLLGWMDKENVEALALLYERPGDIDLMAGVLSERGAPVGPTLGCLMADQLVYWRRADRYWYERDRAGGFTVEQLVEIRKMSLAKLICQHGDGVDAVQPNAFLIPGPGNEITKCSNYEMPNLNVFRDDRCYPKPTPSREPYSEHPSIPGHFTPEHPSIPGHFTQEFDINQAYFTQLPGFNDYFNLTQILTNENHPYPLTNARYPIVPDPEIPNQSYLSSDPTNQGYPRNQGSNMYPVKKPKVSINLNANPKLSKESAGIVSIQGNTPSEPYNRGYVPSYLNPRNQRPESGLNYGTSFNPFQNYYKN